MFSLIDECADNFTNYFRKGASVSSVVEIDMKDTFTRFTNDVIATTAFGIKCDSLKDRENEFFVTSKRAVNFTGPWIMFKFLLLGKFPKLARVS